MKIFRPMALLLVMAACNILFISSSSSDTIVTNDGKEIKGIVVEDYKDRVVFSTVDGEVSVMKSDIRELSFDSEEDNLIKLAEQASEHREYSRAMSYYEKALKINPESAAAKQGIVYLRGNLFRNEEAVKAAAIQRQQDIETYGGQVDVMSKRDDITGLAERLDKSTGIKLDIVDSLPEIVYVKTGSPAYEAGLRKGDRIISVWGKLTGYLSLKDILDLIINKSAIEIRCEIERVVDVQINPKKTPISGPDDLIGASFSMEIDGLTVSSVKEGGAAMDAGLAKDDLITYINSFKTRYMPLNKAVELIRGLNESTVKLTIRRKSLIWRTSDQ